MADNFSEGVMPTSGEKASATKKRRGAAKKAATTRKRRVAAKKAAATRKRNSAGQKAAKTKKRRAAAKKAVATRRSRALDDVDRLPIREEVRGSGFDWRVGCTEIRSIRQAEGGELFSARSGGRYVLVSDESTLADLSPEVADCCITIREFRSSLERTRYLRATRT